MRRRALATVLILWRGFVALVMLVVLVVAPGFNWPAECISRESGSRSYVGM
jgi:hypothetical protein